jgi:hypothetical protein
LGFCALLGGERSSPANGQPGWKAGEFAHPNSPAFEGISEAI